MQYGVDLAIWGHVHAYERLWPVYADVVFNGTAEEPYTNPGAPVHITTGSAVRTAVTTPAAVGLPAPSATESV